MFFTAPLFALIDTETTGLSPQRDSIVEIAVVTLNAQFSEVGQWHTLVNPQRSIPNSRIHGVTQDMVTHAPTFEKIFPELLAQLDGKILLAHNARFDSSMLVAETERVTDVDLYYPFVDTLRLARQVVPSGTSCSLDSLLRHTRVRNNLAHSALGDAVSTGKMLRALFGRKRGIVARKIHSSANAFSTQEVNLPMPSRTLAFPRSISNTTR